MTLIELQIERAVAGGRMLARHDGVVVLVSGAIPGERVRARVEKRSRSLLWARTVEVLDPSPARRVPTCDPACGGLDYAHIEYGAQLRCKAEVILDALRRIGHLAPAESVLVAPSDPSGYRLRARLHVQARRAGFFREGTHELCDARQTRQLRPESLAAVDEILTSLDTRAQDVTAIVVAENVLATQCVLHLEPRDGSDLANVQLGAPVGAITGVTTVTRGRLVTLTGLDHVADTAIELFGADAPVPEATRWVRRPTSFFQGNRFLVGQLARHVLAQAAGESVLDLYAGVGLFAAGFAAIGHRVVAVEGDASAAGDLETNARPWPSLRVIHAAVEDMGAGVLRDARPDTVVLDPPRTGASPEALERARTCGASRLVYVSCDPPTLARDAAKLVAGGYRLASIRAFDLFPETAHVETVAVFDATTA